jgi:hypothetical protein
VGWVFAELYFLPLLTVVAGRSMEKVAGCSMKKKVMHENYEKYKDPDYQKAIAKFHKQHENYKDPDYQKAIAKYRKQVLESDVCKTNFLLSSTPIYASAACQFLTILIVLGLRC